MSNLRFAAIAFNVHLYDFGSCYLTSFPQIILEMRKFVVASGDHFLHGHIVFEKPCNNSFNPKNRV